MCAKTEEIGFKFETMLGSTEWICCILDIVPQQITDRTSDLS